MEGASVHTLQHRPEALDPVGVRLPSDVFGRRSGGPPHAPARRLVGRRAVRIDRRIFLGVFLDEILQRVGVALGHNLGADLICVPILHADDRRLSNRAPARSRQFLPLDVRHVLALAAHVRSRQPRQDRQMALRRHPRPKPRGCDGA